MAKPPKKTDMSTAAVLARAERVQREEAAERAIMQRKSPDIIRTTVRMKETPDAKKQALEAAVRSGKATPARMPTPNVGSGSKMKPARMPTPNVDSMVKRPSSGPFSGKMTPARMPDKMKKGK